MKSELYVSGFEFILPVNSNSTPQYIRKEKKFPYKQNICYNIAVN